MDIIFTLLSLGMIVFFIIAIINVFRGFFSKNWSPLKKSLIGLITCTVLAFMTVPQDDDVHDTSKESSVISSKVKKSSKSSKKISSSLKNTKSSEKNETYTISVSSSRSQPINTSSNVSANTGNNTSYNNDIDSQNNSTENHYANDNLDDTAQNNKVIRNTKTHIYHTADQHNYKINPNNEIVFSNEQQAINAGYRKAKR